MSGRGSKRHRQENSGHRFSLAKLLNGVQERVQVVGPLVDRQRRAGQLDKNTLDALQRLRHPDGAVHTCLWRIAHPRMSSCGVTNSRSAASQSSSSRPDSLPRAS